MNSDSVDADELAASVVATMFEHDAASQAFGMVVTQADAELVRVSMRVRPDMVQAIGTCHGGVIFALADSAFAFACNRCNETAVAAGCSIEYLRAAQEGDQLTAEAIEVARQGRSGVYDIRITNQHGQTVALFRGKSRQIGGDNRLRDKYVRVYEIGGQQ